MRFWTFEVVLEPVKILGLLGWSKCVFMVEGHEFWGSEAECYKLNVSPEVPVLETGFPMQWC